MARGPAGHLLLPIRRPVSTTATLVIDDAVSVTAADNVSLGAVLVVADAVSATTADNVALVQHQVLAIADAASATVADRVILSAWRYPVSIDATNDVWLDQYGDPIFLVGDSGWALSAQTAADIDDYLDGVAAQGLRMVLASAPEPYYTANTPEYRNNNGDDPFTGTPFQSGLNEPYWSNWDHAIEKAHELGIYMLVTPFYLGFNNTEGWRDTLTTAYNANPTNLTNYGAAIAARYEMWPNIGWLIGHDDASLTTQTEAAAELIAAEIAAGTTHLILPGAARGAAGSATWSSTTVAYDLDTAYFDNATPGEDSATVRAASGTFGWVEGYYEQEHSDGIGDQTFREQLWEPFCAGASFAIFGNNPRWHFGLAYPGKPGYAYTGTWQQSLTNATYNVGTVHAGRLASFVAAITDILDTLPDTSGTFLTSGTGFARFSTTVGVAYQTAAASITLDTTELSGTSNVRIRRYDPTDGTFTTVAASEAQSSSRSISHPGNNAAGDPDWVYVVEISTAVTLVIQDAASDTVADNVALVQHQVLAIADAVSVTAADNVALVQHQVIAIADAVSVTAADNVALVQHQVLAIADATSLTAADNVTLTVAGQLAVDDAASATAADNVALVQHHALTVADAVSLTTADNVTLATGALVLAVNDATSLTIADIVALTQHHVLTIADAVSLTFADEVPFSTITRPDPTTAVLAAIPSGAVTLTAIPRGVPAWLT